MKIISNKKKLAEFVNKEKNLGFVPTMGAIHQGHISLIRASNKLCKKTLVSIFINKPQFNKNSDFVNYPRPLKKDISKLISSKVDYLYLPNSKQIYPNGKKRNLAISPLQKKLCGKFRPGHFRAVADVIVRFIKIIGPKKIFLGKKDMQQLKIIEDFVNKNHPEVKIIACNTVREKSGIPFSSRNFLLSDNEKVIASKIYKFLSNSKKKIIKNKYNLKLAKKKILSLGVRKIDYVEIIDINKMIPPYVKKIKNKIFIAYYLGATRLIDNI